jgi:hypothetical protein
LLRLMARNETPVKRSADQIKAEKQRTDRALARPAK